MTNLTDLINGTMKEKGISFYDDPKRGYRVRRENQVAFAPTLVALWNVVKDENNDRWQEFNIYSHGTANEIRLHNRQFEDNL